MDEDEVGVDGGEGVVTVVAVDLAVGGGTCVTGDEDVEVVVVVVVTPIGLCLGERLLSLRRYR